MYICEHMYKKKIIKINYPDLTIFRCEFWKNKFKYRFLNFRKNCADKEIFLKKKKNSIILFKARFQQGRLIKLNYGLLIYKIKRKLGRCLILGKKGKSNCKFFQFPEKVIGFMKIFYPLCSMSPRKYF